MAEADSKSAQVLAAAETLPIKGKRLKPGERRTQILQSLAQMLQQPGAERVTTSALAARLLVSEAALYRHFASKAQMFEGLMDFIEDSIFTLGRQILERKADSVTGEGRAGSRNAGHIARVVVQFAEKNPGLARVMVGDALVYEHARLQQRMVLFFDKLESMFKQCLREDVVATLADAPTVEAQLRASLLTAFLMGRLQRYVRTGFRRKPSEYFEQSLSRLLG